MLIFFTAVLLLLDLALVAGIFLYLKYNKNQSGVLEAITEERIALKRIRAEFDDALQQAHGTIDKKLSQFRQLAAETEREATSAKTRIKEALESVLEEFGNKLEEPLKEFSRRQNSLEGMIRLSGQTRDSLLEAVRKGEVLSKFFHEDIPYEQLLKDIELKKYDDARKLMVKGVPREQIARELGLRSAEVDLIQSLAST